MPELIDGGYVYIGQPPLYRLGRGKSEQFFIDEEALNQHLFQQAADMLTVHVLDGDTRTRVKNLEGLMRKLSNLLQIIEYLERMNLWEKMVYFLLENEVQSADQFGEQDFVEGLKSRLQGSNMNLGNIRPCRWKPSCYEFDTAQKDKAHIVMTIGPQIPLIPEYRSALRLFPQISKYLDKTFVIDTGKKEIPASNWKELLTITKSESFKGSSLQRYKGLGEMNPEQLWETTMHPEKRTLLQVNIEDAENADDIFTTLMGEKVEPRREFIQNHALEVKELDI